MLKLEAFGDSWKGTPWADHGLMLGWYQKSYSIVGLCPSFSHLSFTINSESMRRKSLPLAFSVISKVEYHYITCRSKEMRCMRIWQSSLLHNIFQSISLYKESTLGFLICKKVGKMIGSHGDAGFIFVSRATIR